MKQDYFSRLFAFAIATLMVVSLTNAQVFWSEDFDGGLGDWTTTDISMAGSGNSWAHTTVGPTGGYAAAQLPLASSSAANGWAIFDSDLQCSGSQNGWLGSTSIDCSGKEGVQLTFSQWYRRFFCENIVNVSNDGGTTWTAFSVNPSFADNDNSVDNPDNITIDISSVAADQADVQIAFQFLSDDPAQALSGCGYGWQVDDVALVEVAAAECGDPNIVFCDDFEDGTGQWVLEGAWGLTTTQSNSPSNSLTDSPGGNYIANQNISATVGTGLDLSAALDASLTFSAIYDIEGGNFDYCYVEASPDGGTSWVQIGVFLGEGNLSPWTEYTYSLGGFVGNSDVRIRFRMFTDGGFEVDGIYIDDVLVTISNEDNASPLILHTPPEFYLATTEDMVFTADLIDISGVGMATLTYSVDGGALQTVAGMATGPETYEFTVPAQAAGLQVDYYIEASDASANANLATTDTYSYIAGNHIYYDNTVVDFVADFGPTSLTTNMGGAVRISLGGQTDIKYALIRNYTDVNRPNDDIEFHLWAAGTDGLPGADLIPPFMVTPEADLVINSPMTRVDLSAFSAQLTGLSGDVFVGYMQPTGNSWVVQTTPAVGNRTYVSDGTNWTLNGDDYHFRLVTTEVEQNIDFCNQAADITNLFGGAEGETITSEIYTNVGATTDASDPTTGWECFGEPDGSGTAPSLETTLWYTFTGNGGIFHIETTDCNGTVTDYIDDGDTQIAVYSGTCDALTPVDCNEDVAGTPAEGPYPAGLDLVTTAGVTYYIMVDAFNFDGAISDGEFCLSVTRETIDCSFIALGTEDGPAHMCWGETGTYTSDLAASVVPNVPLSGYIWIVTTTDISGSDDPFSLFDTGIAGPLQTGPYNVNLTNDGSIGTLTFGLNYLTPIVYGGATDAVGDGMLTSLDFSTGCLITGASIPTYIWPDGLPALDVSVDVVNESVGGAADGTATVNASGGSDGLTGGGLAYSWSDGQTTATATGLASGTYTVTISDVTGCVAEVVETVTVDIGVNVEDIEGLRSFTVGPNPTAGDLQIELVMDKTADVKLELMTVAGQQIQIFQSERIASKVYQLDLSDHASGIYLVRLTVGDVEVIQRVVLEK